MIRDIATTIAEFLVIAAIVAAIAVVAIAAAPVPLPV